MKYVRGKIDQAGIEVTQGRITPPGMFSFLKYEHWDIDIVLGKMAERAVPDAGRISGVPHIKIPKRNNGKE